MKTSESIKLNNKTQIIIDLDGTICDLETDWQNWDSGLREIFSKYENLEIQLITNGNIDQNALVKRHGKPLLDEITIFIREYEQKNIRVFTPIHNTITLILQIKDLDLYVWSANSEQTIKRALDDLRLGQYFKKLVGRESLVMQKPDPEGFELIHSLRPNLPKSAYLFIGNAPNDFQASISAGIEYINVNEILIED